VVTLANDYGALLLDGATQGGSVASASHINLGITNFAIDVSFTVSAGGSGIKVLLSKFVSNVGWRIQLSATRLLQVRFNDLTYTLATDVDDAAWHRLHVSVDRQFSLMYVYIDGALDGTLAIANQGTVSNAAALELGNASSSLWWAGAVSEVRLSNRIRHTAPYTSDVIQFGDDNWTQALYHFNEGTATAGFAYDLSTGDQNLPHSKAHLTLVGSPTPTEGPYLACVISIVREHTWLALDAFSSLTTFLAARTGKKYRFRSGDMIPANFTASNTPAITITPATLPDINPETSAFHTVRVPIEIQGRMHHKDVREIEIFWWVTLAAIYNMYNLTTTAGRFNFIRIQNMKSRGPSFEVEEQRDESLFSSFTDTLIFEVRHDFLKG
jgi:hypothetical protein